MDTCVREHDRRGGVIPAKAGINNTHVVTANDRRKKWIPAKAGMTVKVK